ncbi:MAG: hypothetical protein ACFFD4_12625 [Candidatus Odinarchaeota archaeon]
MISRTATRQKGSTSRNWTHSRGRGTGNVNVRACKHWSDVLARPVGGDQAINSRDWWT